MFNLIKPTLSIFLVFLFLYNPFCYATLCDKIPITIQSDKLEYHHQTGVAVHTGHVVVTQKNQLLQANTLSIYRDPHHHNMINKMIAKGTTEQLATFKGKLNEKQPPISGQAHTISYFPQTQKLILEGNALLIKEQDTFSSPLIHFDLAE